jgi:hypothetical protein
MKRYIPLTEEMLDGVVRPIFDSKKAIQVYRIESLAEVKKLGPEPRGAITIGQLYMTKTNSMVLHMDIVAFLRKFEGLNLQTNLNPKVSIQSLKDVLYIQMYKGKALLAESYGAEIRIMLEAWNNKKQMTKKQLYMKKCIEKHLEVLKQLNIPFELRAI